MSKRVGPGPQPDEHVIPADILAEDQDEMDELEENVGVPPRKVTMDEFIGAEKAFDDLVYTEEREIEITPFRPGNTKYVLTDRQKVYLQDCIDQFDKYLKYETERFSHGNEEANKKLKDLNNAMKKIMDVGLDGLTPEERQTVGEYNHIMNDIPIEGDHNLSYHMYNCAGPIGIKPKDIHDGLDMLGVMTGVPATYERNTAEARQRDRMLYRKEKVDKIMSDYSEEAGELVENAKSIGLDELQKKFGETEIGIKLGQINAIVGNLSNYKNASYYIDENL